MKSLYEQIASRGVESLTDRELLVLLTGDEAIADAVLTDMEGGLRQVAHTKLARLRMVGGMGLKRAIGLQVAAEWGRRVALAKAEDTDVIHSSDDVVRLFRPQLEGLAYEECWVVYLTASNRMIERMRVSQGGVQATVVDHRLIIKRALELLATQMIMIHNHPSGAAVASAQDRVLTDRVAEAAALFDIRLLDHLIISREGDYSFRREGLLK